LQLERQYSVTATDQDGFAQRTFASYIGGEWKQGGKEIQVVDPATAQPFARVATVGVEDVKQALTNAEEAFPAWRALTVKDRGALLHRVADELVRRKAEIAHIITRENGKPLAQAEGEVLMSEDHLRWFAEEAKHAYGRLIPNHVAGKRHMVIKTPIGVVGAIAPWNFPLVLAVRKIAPAMAAGCPVVLKPASQTPLSAVLFAECVQAAGVPAGVFQVVIGNAVAVSGEFLGNPICRKISFTGSTRVGQDLIRGAAEHIKPLCLELGGLAPVLVFEDCDLDRAVVQTIIAKFRNTGQSCIAANRIYVQRSIYREFVARFTAATGKLKLGPGLEPGVDVGPVVNQGGLDAALEQIHDAVSKGGRVVAGGERLTSSPGFFLQPTVIEEVHPTSTCMKEETFAPIAPICPFDTEEEAIREANNTPYGLSAYAMTRDVGRIFRLGEQIEAGTLGINDGAPTVSHAPFGGVKQSGWGRELGVEGFDAFTETKHISIAGV
jgi:succinate-semialdehyde dehydrogenase/glutarate-semialdehyde dehydrogenase